jgi:hypothetical protein
MKKKFKKNDDLSETNMIKQTSVTIRHHNFDIADVNPCGIETHTDTYYTIGHRTYKATNDEELSMLARRSFGGRDVESTYYPTYRYSAGTRFFAHLTGNTEMINQIADADECAYREQSEKHSLQKMKSRKK